jgi:hypothetical protein
MWSTCDHDNESRFSNERRHQYCGSGSSSLEWSDPSSPGTEDFAVTYTDADWHKLLTPDQYAMLRHSATERPFTGLPLHEKRAAISPVQLAILMRSRPRRKTEGETSWPSFWVPLEGGQ